MCLHDDWCAIRFLFAHSLVMVVLELAIKDDMKRFDLKVLAVLLSGVHLCVTSQAFAADDAIKAAEALAKLYKLDKSINGYLFGSFAATDEQANTSTKYTSYGKKSGSSGFKIRGVKSLQYKIDQNQILGFRNNGLNYVLTIQF